MWVVISLFKNLVLCSSCINNCWHPSMSVSICAEVKNTFRNVYLLKHIYVYLHINVSQMRTVWPMCGNPRTAVWTAPREDRLCGDWSRDPILWSVSVLCSCSLQMILYLCDAYFPLMLHSFVEFGDTNLMICCGGQASPGSVQGLNKCIKVSVSVSELEMQRTTRLYQWVIPSGLHGLHEMLWNKVWTYIVVTVKF